MDFTAFADVPVVDGHIHFSHPERMHDVLSIMGTVPLARANLVSTPRPETINHNPALIYFKARQPDRVYLSGALDYSTVLSDRAHASERLAAQVATLKAIGFDGLKLIEGKPTARKRIPIPLDAPEYEGMWATLEELRFPVVFHVADPEEFWDADLCPAFARERGWCYADGTYPSKEGLYAEAGHVLERHPDLKIIFAHFYFLSADLERAARTLDAHPNVCLDLTPGVEMYGHFTRQYDAARAFFYQYRDRLVYGTDISSRALEGGEEGMALALDLSWLVRTFLEASGPFNLPRGRERWLGPNLESLSGLALPHQVLEQIYHANFERLYGPAPAPLNHQAALAELERMADATDRLAGGAATENQARQVAEWLKADGSSPAAPARSAP